MSSTSSNRDSLFVEEAEVLQHTAFDGQQFVLRVHAPQTAARAKPGNFAHIQCHPMKPMRRPISIMRVNPYQGEVEFLYKVVGEGTRLLAQKQIKDSISMIAPIGNQFHLSNGKTRPLLIGGGVGMPPMIFLADHMQSLQGYSPFVILGSEVPFPFKAAPSKIMVPGVPEGIIAAMPLLDDWGIANRLASLQGYAGVFEGYVTDLARTWLQALSAEQLKEVEVFSCGPHAMLVAVMNLAKEFDLPCQLSLEEFMACGVGGCAGCTVPVVVDGARAMKRVCVDGPVFPAEAVVLD